MYVVIDEFKRMLEEEKKVFEEMDGFEHLKNLRFVKDLSQIYSQAAESSHGTIKESFAIFKPDWKEGEVVEAALKEIEELKRPIQCKYYDAQQKWNKYLKDNPLEAAKLLFKEALIQKLAKIVKGLE